MIRIGMCDDDLDTIKIAAKFLEAEIIEQDLDAEITIITDNQKEIFNAIYNDEIDILFLDVDFKGKGKNGLDFAKDLRNISKTFYLIFISAHFKYVHLSLENKVFDYLIKPVNRDTIELLVKRLKSEFEKNSEIFLNLNKWASVRCDSIYYIEKVENKCKIVTNQKELYTTKTLNNLIDELPNNFRKCHKSYIANMDKIIGIDKKTKNIYFTKDICCPISPTFDLKGDELFG